MAQAFGPVVLEGRHVRLVPFERDHLDAIEGWLDDHEAFQHLAMFDTRQGRAGMDAWFEKWAADERAGKTQRFAVISREGAVVGSTSLLDYSAFDAHLEIGGTFYARRVWRTAVNTECKRLLLGHAFDALACERVQLRTGTTNLRSQTAIARLGAVREGTLRFDRRMASGVFRSTVYFSILRDEWPAVRARLDGFLAQPPPRG